MYYCLFFSCCLLIILGLLAFACFYNAFVVSYKLSHFNCKEGAKFGTTFGETSNFGKMPNMNEPEAERKQRFDSFFHL